MRVNKKTGEIFMYGVIGGPQYGGDIDEQQTMDALEQIGSNRARVRINSPGGVVDTGIAIYNILKEHKPGVDVVVDSLAASIASVIALAGDNRLSAEGSRWMIHRARLTYSGSAAEIRKRLEITDIYDSSMVEIYAKHMKKSPDEIGQLLDSETWYSASDAINVGLATGRWMGKTNERPRLAAWFTNPPHDLVAACNEKKAAILLQKARIMSKSI